MKKVFLYFIVFASILMFNSCESLLQGMAAGMGGYGTMYNPYATPIGVLPYHLQPEVYAEQVKKAAEQSAQQAAQQMVQNAPQFQNMMNAMPVTSGYVPVTTESSTSSSTSYSNNNIYSGP